jgi:two-component system, LuxR family, sensor kinase FixL
MMQKRIKASLRDVNPWTFTGISVLFAVVLTTGLNSIFAWSDGGTINPKVFFYATIDAIAIPLIIAPIMLNLFKRAVRLEQANQQLQGQVEHHQHAQEASEQRAANLQAISDFSIECAAAAPDVDLHKLIAEKLYTLTGALGVAISEYDVKEQAMITRYVAVSEGGILARLNQLLGRNIIGFSSPISSETRDHLTKVIVSPVSNLSEVSFGAIPKSVSAIIHKAFGIGSFTGLAFTYRGELWGAAIVVSGNDAPPLDLDLAMAFANVAAVAMRRQKTEEALKASEARYHALLEILPDSVVLADLSGNILYCNQQTAIVHGYESAEEMVGTQVLIYFAPEEHANVLARIQSALGTRQLGDTPFMMVKKDGTRFPGELRACLVPGADGNPTGMLGITRDIGERKKAEIEREALIRELKAKNEELEYFTYGVSHDLKSPLITIQGFLGYVEKDARAGDLERLRSDIQRITDATDKMQRLLNELLELSRIGRMMNPSQSVPFESIVQEGMELVMGRITQRGVEVKITAGMPTVYGDRPRLVGVMQNLLDNACKFMGEQAQPRIEVGSSGSAQAGFQTFFVRDNGMGIDAQHKQRVFGLFSKLDANSEGTGVGLALVKRIIEVHGGHIWIESDGTGKGSTFFFTLPEGKGE